MLILKRKVGESFWIGDTHVVVHSRNGNQISLAIDAPKEVRVIRGEADGATGQERDRESAPPRQRQDTFTESPNGKQVE